MTERRQKKRIERDGGGVSGLNFVCHEIRVQGYLNSSVQIHIRPLLFEFGDAVGSEAIAGLGQ